MAETIHNPDQYMSDLRQTLARGRKRLGLLLGAGAPASIRVNDDGKVTPNGVPLIPLTAELSEKVSSALPEDQEKVQRADLPVELPKREENMALVR